MINQGSPLKDVRGFSTVRLGRTRIEYLERCPIVTRVCIFLFVLGYAGFYKVQLGGAKIEHSGLQHVLVRRNSY